MRAVTSRTCAFDVDQRRLAAAVKQDVVLAEFAVDERGDLREVTEPQPVATGRAASYGGARP
jgi:hypothetical protein